MLQARKRLRRVQNYWRSMIPVGALALISLITVLPSSSPAATTTPEPIRALMAMTMKSSPVPDIAPSPPVSDATPTPPIRQAALRTPGTPVVAAQASLTVTPTKGYVVNLIHQDFPANAWRDAEAVAWCESKFRTTDIGFDSNGTHDRGLFQLNDGGTEQYLMAMIGQNPKKLNLAFNPVLNVRAAALLYRRDGWSQWSCQTAI